MDTILSMPNQCYVIELSEGPFQNFVTLGKFPEGSKTKYNGKFYYLKEKKFSNGRYILIYESKAGEKIFFESLPKHFKIMEV